MKSTKPELKDVLEVLEEIVPRHLAEEWDNPGLQIGLFTQKIEKIFIALDATVRTVMRASRRNAQLLLTHHPLIFKPLSCLNLGDYPGNVLLEAVKKEIAIVAIHTNLDSVRGGINDILANLLNLQNVEVLQIKNDSKSRDAGLGRVGDLPKPLKLASFIKSVKEILHAKQLRVVGSTSKTIRRVAVVGGAGGNMVSIAGERGADVLLSGDISHHDALSAESLNVALLDGGHFQTEKTAIAIFTNFLKKTIRDQGWEVSVEVDKLERDPMRFE